MSQVHPVLHSHLPWMSVGWERRPSLLANLEYHLRVVSDKRQRLSQSLALVNKNVSSKKVQSIIFELRPARWLDSWDRFEGERMWFDFRPRTSSCCQTLRRCGSKVDQRLGEDCRLVSLFFVRLCRNALPKTLRLAETLSSP